MIRLLGFMLTFALFLVFIVLNLDTQYKCDVNLGFYSFTDVPVYITSFISIFLGMIFSIPILSSFKRKNNHSRPAGLNRKKKNSPAKPAGTEEQIPGENGPYGIN